MSPRESQAGKGQNKAVVPRRSISEEPDKPVANSGLHWKSYASFGAKFNNKYMIIITLN